MGRNRISPLLALILLSAKVLGFPAGDSTNGTEIDGAFLEDALEKWLGNFDTYMFMVEQDVDGSDGEGGEEMFPDESLPLEEEEEGDEDYDQGSAAPITMTLRRPGGLLDPDIDYEVTLESLVAEGGSVLVTLGNFGNKTACGVGGFSPPEDRVRGLSNGHFNISQQREGNRSTAIVAFAVDTEEEETTTTWTVGDEGSEWEEHSRNLWWAMGRLAGGGLLTLTFTPPECGCLTLKAHYALPVGENLALVVGPEAYPRDLEKLLCIDPSSRSIEENLIELEIDDEDVVHDALGDSDPLQEKSDDTDTSGQTVKGRGRWAARKKAKLQRKKMRQEARQAIRQAGRRVTRQRVRKHMRLRRRDDEAEEEPETRQVGVQSGGPGGRRARKQARKAARKQTKRGRKAWKGKKPWKKHRKHARKHGHRSKHARRNRHHKNHNITGDATPAPEEAFEDLADSDYHLNTTEPLTDEDTLAELLLGEEEEDEDYESGPTTTEVSETVGPLSRRGRKHRRQRGRARKLKNKEKRKGARFCCKHGIKFKKSQLLLNIEIDEEDQPEIVCNNTNDIVSTYAMHQFSVGSVQCSSRYETCCTKFTLQLWENLKAKKAARKAKRKQQRKATRQQKRRQSRRHRGAATTPMTTTTQ